MRTMTHAYEVRDRAHCAAIYLVVPELRIDLPATIGAIAANTATAAGAIKDDKIRGLVPAKYHEFLLLFKKAIANVLLPHQFYDHKITLKEGFSLPFDLLYSLSRPKL